MSAFFVATATIKSLDKFKVYTQKCYASFKPYEGKTLLRGRHEKLLTHDSELPGQIVSIVSFPTMEALNQWHDSDAYQALLPLREEAANVTITSYAVPA